MLKKEMIEKLMIMKSDIKAMQLEAEVLQKAILDDWDGDFDLDGIRVHEKTNVRYTFNKDYSEEFERDYPMLVTKKYLTKDLCKEEKRKYFKKGISKPFIMFD